jgi:hypothetical protein
MVPQLTLMAAALHPWPVLLHVVESAMQTAQQVLFTKVCAQLGGPAQPALLAQHTVVVLCAQRGA